MPTTRVDTARTPRRKRKNAGATLRNNMNMMIMTNHFYEHRKPERRRPERRKTGGPEGGGVAYRVPRYRVPRYRVS